MFGIGGFEFFLIVLFAFLLFGPDKIPVFIKTVRKAVTKFREAEQEVTSALKQEVVDPETGETAADVIDSFKGKSTKYASSHSSSSESFAERKARHERERAEREERQKAEAQQAAEQAAEQAAQQTTAQVEQTAAQQAPQATPASTGDTDTSSTQTGVGQQPVEEATSFGGVSLEDLYATQPVRRAAQAEASASSQTKTVHATRGDVEKEA